MSDAPVVPGLEVIALGAASAGRLAAFCGRATDFFQLIGGVAGGAETAAEMLGPLPAHVTSGTTRLFGLERDADLVGVLELLEGFPTPETWYIGLLVLVPEQRRSGIGGRVWAAVRDWIRARGGTEVRLVVQQQNAGARAFWERQGFSVDREVVAKAYALESRCWRMLRAL